MRPRGTIRAWETLSESWIRLLDGGQETTEGLTEIAVFSLVKDIPNPDGHDCTATTALPMYESSSEDLLPHNVGMYRWKSPRHY